MSTSEGLIIRYATKDDLPELKAFEQGIIRAERPIDPLIKADPISYYDLKAMLCDENTAIAVVEYEGKLVASGYAQKRSSRTYLTPDEYAYIGFLYVSPNQRGLGLNRMILDFLFDWARSRGLHQGRLTVYPENESAVRAYEKVGFRTYMYDMKIEI